MIIALCGYMGAGKSTVGKYLANLLYTPFVDLDEYICKRTGKSIPEIFSESGENAFRAMEQQCLQELVCRYGGGCPGSSDSAVEVQMPSEMVSKGLEEEFEVLNNGYDAEQVTCVLSVGGGTPTNPACAQLLRTRTLCFYLKASLESLQKRLWKNHSQRPLLAGKNKEELYDYVAAMMAQREPAYLACSHHVIHAENKSLATIALEIANF